MNFRRYTLAFTLVAICLLLIYRVLTANEPTNTKQAQKTAPEDTTFISPELKQRIIAEESKKQVAKNATYHANFTPPEEQLPDSLLSPYTTKEEPWETLMKVKYRNWGGTFIPKFEAEQQKYHRQNIEIKGFMYPLEEGNQHKVFVLSYYPVSSCFFCAAAGPESVIEVQMKQPLKLYTRRITLKGKLILNDKEAERLFYILEDAELK